MSGRSIEADLLEAAAVSSLYPYGFMPTASGVRGHKRANGAHIRQVTIEQPIYEVLKPSVEMAFWTIGEKIAPPIPEQLSTIPMIVAFFLMNQALMMLVTKTIEMQLEPMPLKADIVLIRNMFFVLAITSIERT